MRMRNRGRIVPVREIGRAVAAYYASSITLGYATKKLATGEVVGSVLKDIICSEAVQNVRPGPVVMLNAIFQQALASGF